jgi:hypothetical protein
MSNIPQEPQPFPPPKKEPPIITPGKTDRDSPSDAIVLFDGRDLSRWRSFNGGGDPKWKIKDGFVEVVPRTGDIATREEFGDCQLHIEWATPSEVKGEGQERGNSGVFLMERYEVQVLDSYDNKTYYHGQAGAIYKQHAPLVNASRKPGEWQTYDIIFKAPRFKGNTLDKPAVVTVLHNGVAVHNADEFWGPTQHKKIDPYAPSNAKGPIGLQDHGNPVHFRNIWIRPLKDAQ